MDPDESVVVMRFINNELTHITDCRSLRVHELNAISSTLKKDTEELETSLPLRHVAFQKMLSDLGVYLSCGGYSECYDASLIHTLLTSLSNLHNYEQIRGVLFIIYALCTGN